MRTTDLLRLSIPVVLVALLSGCASDGSIKRWGQCALIGGGTGGVIGAIESAGAAAGGAVAGALLGGLLCSYSSDGDSDFDGVKDSKDRCPDSPIGVRVDEFGCTLDSDKDGVPDKMDKCPNTPPGVAVNAEGCPDSDNDGVPDNLDQCPDTPAGVPVDAKGCPVSQDLGSILFKFDKADLDDNAKAYLDKVAMRLKEDKHIKLKAFGYTDSSGVDTYNEKLSKRRAETVKQYLVDQGVQSEQVEALIGGIVKAHNDTREGRALNRKVELYTGI